MNRVVDTYATQLRLLWEWRGGWPALVKRGLITLIVATIAFVLTAAVMPGMTVDSWPDAVLAIVLITAFNALVRPALLAIVAPWSLIATSILVLVLQVVAFLVVATWSPGVHMRGFGTALVGSFVYAAINTLLTAILGVDRGGSYFGLLVQSLRAKHAAAPSDKPGLVILQIDGLAYPILAGRVRAGSVNTMAGWIRDGSHRLDRWEALLPSMTSAGQLGILHGNNDGLPAFRWFERDRQRLMVSSKPADAATLVERHSDGAGILSNDGVSICNLVTGDATRSYLTTAALAEGSRGLGDSSAFYGFFLSPTGYLRSITLFIGEFVKERYQARRTRRAGIRPQMHRGAKYAAMRAASNVILRDVIVSLTIEEMYRGANVVYADFTDYDEIAHHSGPERVEAFEALDGIDGAIATIVKAAEDAPRPYRFVVLSDHGQSLGATFRQRYGESLSDLVLRLMGGRAKVSTQATAAEGSAFVNAFLSEVTRGSGAGSTVTKRVFAGQTHDGIVDLDTDGEATLPDPGSIVVVGSGNLGLVYFTGNDHRLTLEELEEQHPGLVSAIAAHPGVSVVLVRSATRGGLAIGATGIRHLADGTVEGDDPIGGLGRNALASLQREDGMADAPDLLLISQVDPELGEVAAFEELIGSHGGLGGMQTEPFILHPADWELAPEVPVGAPALYANLRRWLESIGIGLGPTGAEASTARGTSAARPAPKPAVAAAAVDRRG
ncbi:MAG TPA: phage holin family protein [Candidatus Limnocylindrales bacterium]|nr:phage holin family protein [Candidatus Limnocylindrales bacterium]